MNFEQFPVPGQKTELVNQETMDAKSKKEIAWEKQEKEVEQIADSLGEKIDDQIKQSVVAFNVMRLSTAGSCEGHTDHGMSAPWIEVAAPDQPKERFIGQKKIEYRIAEKYDISVEEVQKGKNYNAYAEAVKEYSQNNETPEYKQWRDKTQKLKEKAINLLEEFYQEREVDSAIRLQISQGGEGEFRVHNGGEDYKSAPKILSDAQKQELIKRLVKYQEEMKQFAEFLRDKYFAE